MSAVSKTVDRQEHHALAREDAGQEQEADTTPAPYFRWKGLFDRCAAAVLLIPGLPLIALLVLLVRNTSRGPGIYRQARVGKHRRRFLMYKIRTMRQDAEAKTGPVWTKVHDPRITRLGKVLRKLHLDELPQLYNVLRGEMSLVGPRPERPEIIFMLEQEIPHYSHRLAVRPGVTGLAQINLPPDTTIDSVRDKLVLDLEYIQAGGAFMDLRIYLCTLLRMFGVRGTLPAQALGLWYAPRIPEIRERQQESLSRQAVRAADTEAVVAGAADTVSLTSANGHAGNGHTNGNGHANGNVHVGGNGHARHDANSDSNGKVARYRKTSRHAK